MLRRLRALAVVAALVAAEAAPALLHALAPAHGCPALVGGALACAALGLALETLADFKKAAFKQRARELSGGSAAADDACTCGVFACWRHPNYAGDLLYWGAIYAGGLPSLAALLRKHEDAPGRAATLLLAAVATAGQIAQVAIMLSRAIESEASQKRRYGESEAFRAYLRRSGSLLPRLWARARPD
jgi:steroid 5-alpha reductase family enzyme